MNYYSEKLLESRLVSEVKKLGGKCYKWVSPGNNGVPDRIVIMPKNKIYFVELKSTGQKPRPLQVYVMKQLMTLGCLVYVIDDLNSLNNFLNDIQSV